MSPAAMLSILFVLLTLGVTRWAARRQGDGAMAFFTADGRLAGWQNGLALAGDYLSAAAFLGAAGLYFTSGYDSAVYAVGTLFGWPLLLILLAGRLRDEREYTLAGVLAKRFDTRAVRGLAAASSLTVTLFYLIVQMVGAGKLVALLFGLPYAAAVSVVGVLMVLYAAGGGMLATSWVQMIKAMLLFGCGGALAAGVLAVHGGSVAALFADAAAHSGQAIFLPSRALADPVEVLSLGVGLVLGLLGLPHVLMRFVTVPNARAAHRSVLWATGLIALFFAINMVIGYGAVALLPPHAELFDAAGKLVGGSNMAAVQLARVLGGAVLGGFVAAVAFATILAVVAGLALAGASVVSHDLYAGLLRRGRVDAAAELKLARWAVIALGALAVALSLAFQDQNVAFLFGLAFALAASSNFPLLLLSLFWPKLTARGVIAGGIAGIAASVGLIVAGPAVWVAVLGFKAPLFPYTNPALFSVPLAFAAAWLGSVTDRAARRAALSSSL
ncbi:cation acetate symporter [Crenobacter sp. SG2303]|uniref:Cation acetate symporter n=1 Tax=Crenobacter oryzisoli TaxID=3056844 RepID=A0ABT7XMP8_9NEIS|nr:cation acetate symporter [Crenobacter sp. SG2303]MDN0074844.1 cation acetate symporter [Crenobacter sp. SG2303]